MQNFTLGKKGLSMLFLTFIFLTSSFSASAQNCPTVTDTTQEFCYLATVSDLEATANGDAVRWYRTAASTNPIPENELLQTGTYYAGNASGTCASRVPVSVTVDDAGAPEPQFGNIFAPCVYGTTGADVKTVQDLINNIDGFQVEIYEEQFSGDPLAPSTPLEIGESYYAGQRNEDTGCPTSRVAVRYDPVFAPAPTAESVQTFCEQATVADLEAQATSEYTQGFRWYSTATSQPPLASTTELIDGETYYVSQIVNRDDRNEPPCESRDRFEVTVVIQEPINFGSPEAGVICESDIQETFPDFEAIENFYLNLLPAGTPTDGTFNPTAEEIAAQYAGPGDYTTTYTVNENGCESSVTLTATVIAAEDANAGSIDDVVIACDDEDPINLASLPNEEGSTGGTFTGEGVDEDGNFNPSTVGPGTYTITYSVDENADCVVAGTSDSTTFTITIQGSSGEPIPVMGMICETEVEAFPDFEAIENYLFSLIPGVDQNGTFDPTVQELASQYSGPGDYIVTYTLNDECGTVYQITVRVNPEENAEAGTISNMMVACDEEEMIMLNDSLLSEGATTGGTFTGEGVNDGNFDPSVGPGTYTITYSVDENSADCVTPGTSDSTTFTITVQGSSGEPIPVMGMICETEVEAFPDFEAIENYLFSLIPGVDQNGTFDPTVQELASQYSGPGDYIVTYTLNDECGTVYQITVRVNPEEDAEAGTISNMMVACDEDEMIMLNDSLLSEDATTGGTYTGEGVNNGNFDPSIGPGTYTITYSVDENSADCVTPGTSDSTTFTITVQGTSGEPVAVTGMICQTEAEAFPDFEAIENYLFSLIPGVDQNGTFDPTIQELAGQYVGPGDYMVTYTLNDECGTVYEITVTVTPTEDAEAGTISNIVVACDDEDIIMLNDSLLSEDATTGGTFTGEGVNEDGNFDPSVGPGSYTITYSVDDSANCVTPGTQDETTFTITIQGTSEEPVAVMGMICETEVEAFPDFEAIETYLFSLIPGVDQNGTFDPTIQELAAQYVGPGDYMVTYTVNDDCGTSYQITVRVTPVQTAEAGSISNIVVACDNEDMIMLNESLLSEDANTGGTFTGEGVNADGNFDPSVGPGTYTITYSVDDSANCVTPGTSDSTTFTITVNEGDVFAGTPGTGILCRADVAATFPDFEAVRNYLLSLLDEDVSRDGTFSPSVETLVNNYNSDADGLGDFQVTYTVGEGDCQASVALTVQVVENANAGTNGSVTLNEDDAPVNLFSYLGGNPMQGGTWSPGNGTFNPATDAPGTYTYTVGTASCQDSATVTVTVTSDPTDPTCEDIAGADNSTELCNADVIGLTEVSVRDLYLGLLEDGVPANGTFNPTIPELINQYNNVSNFGDFTTTYTVVDGECSDSVVLTVTVIEANDAGDDMALTFCTTDAALNLFDFLSPLATSNGTFTGYPNGTFNPSTATVGVTTITYTVEEDDSVCSRDNFTSTFTITVTAPQAANAGGDKPVTYCVENTADVQLTSLLGTGAITTGTFSAPYASGVFNPSTAGVGVYPITYTVGGSGCITGTATATITITVTGTPPTPVAAAAQSFCIVDNPTVADLEAEGENLVWRIGSEIVSSTAPLMHDTIYTVVSSTGSGPCETSDSVSVTVTLNTEVSPTQQQTDSNEFCRQDNPTVADLIANLNGTAIRVYTSNTGGTALATTVALQDGVIYYATSTNATTGCESDERRAITVEVGFCGIPEGFSPNGDGINDRFVIPDIAEDYPNYTIEIFNRWGNVVFKGNANTPDWDGVSNQSTTLGDKVLPAGVYFYIVNYNDGSTPSVQGKLYLSR